MNKYSAVVFDMDGTILNTLLDITDSVNYMLSKMNMPNRTENEIRSFLGSGVNHLISCSVPEGTDEETFEKCLNIYLEHYQIHCEDKTKPYDGIVDTLKELKNKGYKLAVVSNKQEPAVLALADKFFYGIFDAVVGDKEGQRRKPAPDGLIDAVKKLNVPIEEVIFVGDSDVDYNTAVNAKVPCIAVTWGFRDKDFLEKLGANIFAEKAEDLLYLL